MRIGAVLTVAALAAAATVACGDRPGDSDDGGFFRQYEYQEEVYLSLDGSATVYVHSSLPALNALRGTSFATSPNAALDRDAVRRFFSTPVTRVAGQVNASRRRNRRFVHVKLEVDDIRRLGEAAPFAWSAYEFDRDGDLFEYRQHVGAPVGKHVGEVGWTGQEIVAFRLHLPSEIAYHNSGRPVGRGNIVGWEQPLSARLDGEPVSIDARMEPNSILYRTLWLFGWTAVAVVISFVAVISLIIRRAPTEQRIA